jgi:hypothetical protein
MLKHIIVVEISSYYILVVLIGKIRKSFAFIELSIKLGAHHCIKISTELVSS